MSCPVNFGEDAKQRFYPYHKAGVIRLNHGSFGAPPSPVLEAKRGFEDLWNTQPDEYYFNGLTAGLKKCTQELAEFVNSPPENMCLVDNATTGAVIVAQHVGHQFAKGECKPGDVILIHGFIYAAVTKIFRHYTETVGAEIVDVPLPFPISEPGEVLESYKKVLESLKGRRIRLAIVDHISSIPSIIFPLEPLNKLLREYGVEEIFVDGAHAVGAVPLDLQTIDCDYYTSNCHKWLFCPDSVGFFYYRNTGNTSLHHPIVSHNFGQGLFNESVWIGTRDYSSMLTVSNALAFVKSLGVEKIMAHNHDLVWKAAVKMTTGWGTRIGAPESMVSTLSIIELPPSLSPEKFDNDGVKLRAYIRENFNIEAFTFFYEGRFWIRLSAQIYNSESDYDALYDAINNIKDQFSQ